MVCFYHVIFVFFSVAVQHMNSLVFVSHRCYLLSGKSEQAAEMFDELLLTTGKFVTPVSFRPSNRRLFQLLTDRFERRPEANQALILYGIT